MGLKNVFDRMFLKHLTSNVVLLCLCTVYQSFYDECLKNISSKTFISSAIL